MTPEQEQMIMKADIREIKLMDGSTIMAEVLDDSPEAMLLFEPLQVLVGANSASFVPWFLTGDERYVEVFKTKMVAASRCAVDYKVKYLQATFKKEGLTAPFLDFEEEEETPEVVEIPEESTVH